MAVSIPRFVSITDSGPGDHVVGAVTGCPLLPHVIVADVPRYVCVCAGEWGGGEAAREGQTPHAALVVPSTDTLPISQPQSSPSPPPSSSPSPSPSPPPSPPPSPRMQLWWYHRRTNHRVRFGGCPVASLGDEGGDEGEGEGKGLGVFVFESVDADEGADEGDGEGKGLDGGEGEDDGEVRVGEGNGESKVEHEGNLPTHPPTHPPIFTHL